MPIKDSIFAVMIVICASFKSIAADVHHYEFAKLILPWPPSSCNTGEDDCRKNVPGDFIIGSFVPMYFEDTVVPPYNHSDPCVDQAPISALSITDEILERFPSLNEDWPYLLNVYKGPQFIGERNRLTHNVRNWRNQWRNHGKCYAIPIEHLAYFSSAVHLRHIHAADILDKLVQAGLGPDTEARPTAFAFAIIVHDTVGKWPQIRCNRDASKHLQLHEVALCFDTENEIIDCKEKFVVCEKLDLIKFPLARSI